MLKWPIWLCLLPSMISQSSGGALYLDLKHFWKGQALSTPSKELLTGSGETIKLSRFAYILSSPACLAIARKHRPGPGSAAKTGSATLTPPVPED